MARPKMTPVSATVADNKTRGASRYVYFERSREDVRQHIQYCGFRETMRQAYGGELEPLHEYLRAFLPDHAYAIIEWARRCLRQDYIKRVPSPERVAEDMIIAFAKFRLIFVRQQFGDRPLPHGEYQRVIDEVWSFLAEGGDLNDADYEKISNERILKVIGRGKRPERSRYVCPAQSPESMRHHPQYADFPETMRQAYGGKLEPLHEYLCASLPRDHADMIMEWAKPRLRRGLKLVPRKREAEDLIIGLVKHRSKYVRQRLGGQSLPGGEYQRLIDQLRTELVEDGVLDPADLKGIDNDRILEALRRTAKV
jgi:hypothetical protein